MMIKTMEDLRRETKRIIQNFRYLDDDFMTKCFEENKPLAQFVLRILLQREDLKVSEVHTQVFSGNLCRRSLYLDIVVKDSLDNPYNIEIQRDNRGAGRKRARYHSSKLDVNHLHKGDDFDQLPECYVIFITEHDVLGEGKALYHIERQIRENGKLFEDGSHILYVNGAYRGDDAIGRLMHDFSCKNASDMYYEELAKQARYYKESKEGYHIMCQAIEEMQEQILRIGKAEGKEEGKIEGMKKGMKKGLKQGRKEGKKEGLLEAAQKLLASGHYTTEQIIELLGLSNEDAERLSSTVLA